MKKVFLLFVFVLNCVFVRAQIVSDYFSVDTSTKQSWAAGIEEGGTGTNYIVRLTMKKNAKIDFDSIWIDGFRLKISASDNQTSFKDSAQVQLFGSIHFSYSDFYPVEHETIVSPVKYSGAALISYKVHGKIFYAEIKTVTELEFLAYP